MKKTEIVKVAVDKVVDMTKIYKAVSMYCIMADIKCPVIFPYQDLPDDIKSVCGYFTSKDENIIVTSDKLSEEETIKEIINKLRIGEKTHINGATDIYMKYDMTMIYYVSAQMAESLKIRCPMVFFAPIDGKNGIVYNESQCGKSLSIFLGQSCLYENTYGLETYHSLAHEMRHAWQHEKHGEKYFKDYDFTLTGSEYRLMEAEVDAEAYANRFMEDCFGINKPWKQFDSEVTSAIANRKKSIFPYYTKALKEMCSMIKG